MLQLRRHLRIVVIEDSDEDRAEVERLLQHSRERRYTVVSADSGAAGLAAVRSSESDLPDCVILDYSLNDMLAPEVLSDLADADGLQRCAVVVLTGHDSPEIGRRVLRAGAHDYLSKASLQALPLARAIDNAIERCAMQRELQQQRAAADEHARRDAFFLAFSEALRSLADPQQVKAEATRRLGQHLRASRVVYGEVRNGRDVVIEQGYAVGLAQIDGHYRLDDYGARLQDELSAGRNIVVDDIANDPAYTAEQKAAHAALELAAYVWVPLRNDVSVVGLLAVHQSAPRRWSVAEVSLVEETAERTWHALQRAQMQASQRQSELRLQMALQAGKMGVWRWVPSTDVLEIDAALAEITGLPQAHPARTSGQQFLARIDAADRPQVDADVARIMAEGGDYDHEFVFHRPDGHKVWLSGQAVAVAAEGFMPRHLVGINVDVTQRKQAEHALRASQSRLAQVIDVMPAFAAVLRGPDHVFELCNPPYYRLVGRDASILGKPVRQALPEIIDQPFPSLLDRVYQTGEPFEAEGMPAWLSQAGGGPLKQRFLDFSCTPLREADGTVGGILISGFDRTQQARAEQALLQSQLELQSLADNTPDILTRFDRQYRHRFVNAAVLRATGQPAEQFLGRTNRELGMPDHLCVQWEAALESVLQTGQPSEIEFDFMSPQGPRHYSARLVPERGASGDIDQVLGVTRDTTEQKQSERLLRHADRRKDEFLATLAHELRNPLAPIRNGLAILRRDIGPQQTASTVAMMDRQLSQLVNLVDDLLDLSRVSLDKIDLRLQRLSVVPVIEAALEACRPVIEAKRHTLTVEAIDPHLEIDADRTRMVQVVVNLLTNASKYTDQGGTIGLSAVRDGQTALIRVSDNGVGISAEVLPTLWSLFTQVRDTLDKAQGGLGIGLSLVKKLVEMHHGSVDAVSPGLGQGSVFSVRIPLAAAAADEAHAAIDNESPSPLTTAPRRRVLVVDDNEDSARSLALLLESFGHQTHIAHDGLQAVAAAGSFKPELVLLDIGLPGIDGYEVARLLREDGPSRGMVLVAVTGWGTEEDKRRAKVAGFDHHLTKPVRIAAIQALLGAAGGAAAAQDTVW